MKKILALVLALCLILGLAGCSQKQTEQVPGATIDTPLPPDHASEAERTENTGSAMRAIALPVTRETVNADEYTILFSLSVQTPQLNLQNKALEEKILGDLLDRTDPVLEDADQYLEQAQQDYPATMFWSKYFIDFSYVPTRLDQRVMSLLIKTSSYCGGSHPSLYSNAVTYDLTTGDVLSLEDILTPECTSETLLKLVSENLSLRAEELYEDYQEALNDHFSEPLSSISNWYLCDEGLYFHFNPYELAPYSIGPVTARFPYDTLNGILLEEFFPTVPTDATGSMYVQFSTKEDSERFRFIADAVLQEEGSEVLLYPDASVTDLRIEYGYRDPVDGFFTAESTVFAANVMDVGDAIRLKAELSNPLSGLQLVYRSDHQEYSVLITTDEAGRVSLIDT